MNVLVSLVWPTENEQSSSRVIQPLLSTLFLLFVFPLGKSNFFSSPPPPHHHLSSSRNPALGSEGAANLPNLTGSLSLLQLF